VSSDKSTVPGVRSSSRANGASNSLEIAVRAAERGWAVAPGIPGTKKASDKWKPELGRWGTPGFLTPNDVRRNWPCGPRTVLVLTGPSGLVDDDLDADSEGNPAGAWDLENLAADAGVNVWDLPATFTLDTPGGTHLVWKAPRGREFKSCAARRLAPERSPIPGTSCFDVRGQGGLFVLYDPTQPDRRVADDRDPVVMPSWLAELHPEPSYVSLNGHGPAADIPDVRAWLAEYGDDDDEPCEIMAATRDKWLAEMKDGTPHDVMTAAQTALVGDRRTGHVGLSSALRPLMDAFEKAMAGKSRQREWLSDWRNSLAGAIRAKVGKLGEPREDDPCADDELNGKELVDPRTHMRENFWNAREELALVRKWAQARMVSPMAALGEVLAEVVCHTPPFVQLPPLVGGNGTLNMLIALTGHSGTGKGGASGVALDVIRCDGPMDMQRIPVGSGEGIPKAFGYMHYDAESKLYELARTSYSAIIEVKEIDSLTAINSRTGSTLTAQLRQFYSGEQLGYWYADIKRRVIIPAHSYRGCVVAGVQPGCGAVILNDTDSGFAQRWLWLPATDPDAPVTAPREPGTIISWKVPDCVLDWKPGRNKPYFIEVCQKATDKIRSARLPVLRGETDGLEGHKLYTRLKVAAALALLDGGTEVNDEDWDLAGYLIHVSDGVRNRAEEELRRKAVKAAHTQGRMEGVRAVAASETTHKLTNDRIGKKVIELMPDGHEWASGRDIKNKIAARDRELLPEVLSELVEAGKLESRKVTYRGQEGVQHRIPPE
jgi:hypothetical protein